MGRSPSPSSSLPETTTRNRRRVPGTFSPHPLLATRNNILKSSTAEVQDEDMMLAAVVGTSSVSSPAAISTPSIAFPVTSMTGGGEGEDDDKDQIGLSTFQDEPIRMVSQDDDDDGVDNDKNQVMDHGGDCLDEEGEVATSTGRFFFNDYDEEPDDVSSIPKKLTTISPHRRRRSSLRLQKRGHDDSEVSALTATIGGSEVSIHLLQSSQLTPTDENDNNDEAILPPLFATVNNIETSVKLVFSSEVTTRKQQRRRRSIGAQRRKRGIAKKPPRSVAMLKVPATKPPKPKKTAIAPSTNVDNRPPSPSSTCQPDILTPKKGTSPRAVACSPSLSAAPVEDPNVSTTHPLPTLSPTSIITRMRLLFPELTDAVCQLVSSYRDFLQS